MLKDPTKFIDELKSFDKENIDDWVLDAVNKLTAGPLFTAEIISKKS